MNSQEIDRLVYTYDTGGNRLTRVTDSAPTAFRSQGFLDGNTTGNDYSYDLNGNMTQDKNKGITQVEYNHLNLPQKIVGGSQTIEYIYTASGQKLQKKAPNDEITSYSGNFIYEGTSLKQVLHGEGYIDMSGTPTYHYYLKDHLGNNRMVVNQSGTVVQQTDYYPFGMAFNKEGSSDNKYLYNGKELQEDAIGNGMLDWLDYGARMYDPTLGRFHTVDPVAIAMPQWSTYAYSFNNPVRFTDPDGSIPYDKCADNTTKIGHYGMRTHPVTNTQKMHRGTDLTAREGSSINSFASGTVVHVGESKSWGNYVVVDHGKGYFSLYAHVKDGGVKVVKGQKVGDGHQIGQVGSTGISTGSHLHMEVGKADNLGAFLSVKNRDETRTDAAEIGDLEKFLHPENNSDMQAVKESDIKDKDGNVVGTKYENTGNNQSAWTRFVDDLIQSITYLTGKKAIVP
jgi:RHS repeat-associated protein